MKIEKSLLFVSMFYYLSACKIISNKPIPNTDILWNTYSNVEINKIENHEKNR